MSTARMNRCPTCSRLYAHDSLRFCRHDGAYLWEDAPPAPDDATRLLDAETPGSEELRAEESPSSDIERERATTSSSLTALVSPRRRAPRKIIDSLAVLPFVNESGDPSAEYLCDGITESIINSLSQLPKLRVLPRSTVSRYRGREIEPQRIGRELGARAVLTGRVLQLDEWLIVKAELIDVVQDAHLWGEQYRRELTDIFALQEELSQDISQKLRVKLNGEERRRLGKRDTENTNAYHAYLRGRHYVTSKRTEDWIRKGVECFQQAIDLDPNYALAYAGLADAYAFLASSTGERPPREAYPKAKAAAEKALELDATLAEAHTSLGFFLLLYDWDFPAAERAFKRAVKLNPRYANAHDGLGFFYKATGQHEKALRECEETTKLEPLSPFADLSLGWGHYFAHRYERAAEQGRRALEMEPRFAFAHWLIGVARAQAGQPEAAVAALEQAVESSGGGLTFRAHLGYAYALAGRSKEARHLLAEFAELARAKYVSAYYFALIHLGLGERDQMFDYLEQACEERVGFLAFLKVEPMFDPVRAESHFAELLQRIGPTS
ncbi:MAG: tetratricopeptide repeat protein [Pyrinomonadaceae bacterium]